jgi:hypothetical protein
MEPLPKLKTKKAIDFLTVSLALLVVISIALLRALCDVKLQLSISIVC